MLRIRLRPLGRKDRKFYHIVVSDTKTHVTKGNLEVLGYLNPIRKEQRQIKCDRVSYWLLKGAKVSERVFKIIRNEEAIDFPKHILKDFKEFELSFDKKQNKGISKAKLKESQESVE